jgi:hypothetical protein
MRADIVITSIGDGSFLDVYGETIIAAERADDVRLIVIPDRKTPASLFDAVERQRARGLKVVCPDLDEQARLLDAHDAHTLVTLDSENRRNIGFLLSYASDAEYMISVDDDNLPLGADFFERHEQGFRSSEPQLESQSGWFNCCELLAVEPDIGVYPRGYPYAHRAPAATTAANGEPLRVVVNAGLWLGDPDIDAATRITLQTRSTELRGTAVLGRDTWGPINSQNTALRSEAIPAYLCAPLGYRLLGTPVERFGDIFSGYFTLACAKALGDTVRYGDPLVRHDRNDHDLLHNLRHEVPGMVMLEAVTDFLTGCRLTGSCYSEVYLALSEALQDFAETLTSAPWRQEDRAFLHRLAFQMRRWVAVLGQARG